MRLGTTVYTPSSHPHAISHARQVTSAPRRQHRPIVTCTHTMHSHYQPFPTNATGHHCLYTIITPTRNITCQTGHQCSPTSTQAHCDLYSHNALSLSTIPNQCDWAPLSIHHHHTHTQYHMPDRSPVLPDVNTGPL